MQPQKREFYEYQGKLVLEGKLFIDPSNDEVRNKVLEMFNGTNPGLVLNIGIGLKPIVDIALIEKGYKVIGIDICHSFMKIAKEMFAQKRLNPYLVIADAIMLPFSDAIFDFCICSEIIEHLQEPEGLLREVNRVLKPQGKLILTTPNKISLAKVILTLKHKFNKESIECYKNISHVREYTNSQIVRLSKRFFKLQAHSHTKSFPIEGYSFCQAPVAKICNFLVSIPYLDRLGNHILFLFEKLSKKT